MKIGIGGCSRFEKPLVPNCGHMEKSPDIKSIRPVGEDRAELRLKPLPERGQLESARPEETEVRKNVTLDDGTVVHLPVSDSQAAATLSFTGRGSCEGHSESYWLEQAGKEYAERGDTTYYKSCMKRAGIAHADGELGR